jgi:hypothetical protein
MAIKEDYVSFEIAKLLKEKGFDARCPMIYTADGEMLYTDVKHHNMYAVTNKQLEYYTDIIVPTQAMAMKWLRETHDIDFDINTTGSRHVRRYHLAIWENKDEEMVTINPIGYFNKWEQACEAAIKYCLEHLI